ncbi:HAD family hydrolase [Staphylococcus simiae]|uniref:HAD family hydrolase n=1 Tax=Staphylococcus simiae CCM 7213 = CCUG 51256 TaxID=911238 RepID=G5JFR1_9STAP|nr:HAD hydrolase-like protein [Staphylococcus simiae]EHJ08964.1 hypothetical protein SS7213T_01376 [Staphylococcus simiae CCM 7213 = CCUG 51256]PNZ12110.1 HAD family hydrolase [Staphylococcus simiae]SNV74619.1 Hpr(Ser) kinase [Staphylococcus simiae]
MATILFDVDGVFLSEERCFDVSALTVYELLMDKAYLGLAQSQNLATISNQQITEIREQIFLNDTILNKLKSLGLNSNWDMLFIVFSIHFIELLTTLNQQDIDYYIEQHNFDDDTLQHIGQLLNNDAVLDYQQPLQFLSQVHSGKSNIYQALEQFAAQRLNIKHTNLFSLKGKLWVLAQEVYQEWYLGTTLFSEVEQKASKTDFKKGFIYQEVILRPITEVKQLLEDLINSGYSLGIATGRPYTETIVPFETLGLLNYFDKRHIATASDVLTAEELYPQYRPLGKPNPFSYIAALKGNVEQNYEAYAQHQHQIVAASDVYIVGDSLADLLSAQAIGATFIGTLTGLKGQQARKELEDHNANYIVDHIGDIRKILL